MTPKRLQRVRAVLNQRQPDLTVLLDNVHKPHNFSAILRTCDATGVFEAHGVWPEPALKPMHHTSGGSGKWVKVNAHPTLDDAAAHLREQGFRIYAAHLSGQAVDYRTVDYTEPSAILLGAELTGVSDVGLALADQHIVIPMNGMVQSLNVSVAAAVVLFEAQRQRLARGLYAHCRLDETTYRKTLFEWLHPEVAHYCRVQGLNYPPMGDDGEVIDFVRER